LTNDKRLYISRTVRRVPPVGGLPGSLFSQMGRGVLTKLVKKGVL
jgi:hypothetical protein